MNERIVERTEAGVDIETGNEYKDRILSKKKYLFCAYIVGEKDLMKKLDKFNSIGDGATAVGIFSLFMGAYTQDIPVIYTAITSLGSIATILGIAPKLGQLWCESQHNAYYYADGISMQRIKDFAFNNPNILILEKAGHQNKHFSGTYNIYVTLQNLKIEKNIDFYVDFFYKEVGAKLEYIPL